MTERDGLCFRDLIATAAGQLGIEVTQEALDMFEEYRRLLLAANEVMNLTSITDDEGIALRHFVDSLTCILSPAAADYSSLVDVGTGAGFPGLVLHIVRPSRHTLLIDSVGKKVSFVQHVCRELGLENVEAVHGRAEDLAKKVEYRESFDLAVARGVSKLSPLAEYCLPFVRIGGWFLAMKGPRADEELEQRVRAAQQLGGAMPEVLEVVLPYGHGERKLISIRKEKRTASRFPRRHAVIAKNPL